MKAVMLLDGGRPKIGRAELRKALEKAGVEVVERKADFGVVVGGDGKFSRYGRTEEIPLLFVGVRSRRPTGSCPRCAGWWARSWSYPRSCPTFRASCGSASTA